MNKVLYKNSEHTILYKDKKCKIMYKDKPYQDEELNYPSIVLCHFEDDFVNNQITDSKGIVWTKKSGMCQITDTKAKFGTHCLELDGGYIDSEHLESLNLDKGDFTLDFWVYPTSSSRGTPAIGYYFSPYIDISSYRPNMWFLNASATAWVISGEGGGAGVGTINIQVNQWSHLAIVRNGSSLSLYVNGQLSKSANIGNVSTIYNNNSCLRIGAWDDGSYKFKGYIDEFRFTDVAVWTDEFTPPTKPYNN